MKVLKLSRVLLAVAVIFSAFSCSQDSDLTNPNEAVDFRGRGHGPQTGETIVDVAIANPDFSILVDAVVRAGLVDALSSEGPFTVFAPTNDAFLALLDDLGFDSLDDVPVDVLTTILLTHVVAGEFEAADLSTGYIPTLAEGPGSNATDLYVSTESGVVINGGINVVIADVSASNGVIHAIDAVINPSDLVTLIASNPNFSSLVAALTRPDLSIDFIGALNGGDIFTIVAPNNDAFQALLDSNPDWNDLNDIPADLLEAVLSYHVAPGVNFTSNFLLRRPTVNTLLTDATYTTDINFAAGRQLVIVAGSNTADVQEANIQAQNGVFHEIDAVILP